MALYVGTSGWAYPEWRGVTGDSERPGFYPAGLARSRWLEYYATKLKACEINATFYRKQSPATMGKWAAATPPGFRFAVKAHRALTHSASTAPPGARRALLDDYLRSLAFIGDRLGVVLCQFPAHKARDDAGVMELLTTLGRSVPFAADFGHDSWSDPDVPDVIAAAGGTMCYSDYEGVAATRLPPGTIAYVRLRADRYDKRTRGQWCSRLLTEAANRDVYAFAKHKGIAPEDEGGGVGLACWLEGAQDA
jgi:uncharacterized protein YecE (DUF72 family)